MLTLGVEFRVMKPESEKVKGQGPDTGLRLDKPCKKKVRISQRENTKEKQMKSNGRRMERDLAGVTTSKAVACVCVYVCIRSGGGQGGCISVSGRLGITLSWLGVGPLTLLVYVEHKHGQDRTPADN